MIPVDNYFVCVRIPFIQISLIQYKAPFEPYDRDDLRTILENWVDLIEDDISADESQGSLVFDESAIEAILDEVSQEKNESIFDFKVLKCFFFCVR